jgi:hypothetical protein
LGCAQGSAQRQQRARVLSFSRHTTPLKQKKVATKHRCTWPCSWPFSDTDHLCTLALHATALKQWERLPYKLHPLQTKEQADCLGVFTKCIVDPATRPFKAVFPEVATFCEPTALFSAGNTPTAASKVLVVGFFATNRFFPQTGGGTTGPGCCDAQFDRRPGQVPQQVGGPAVHLYEHQGRIELQHLGFSCPHKCLSLAPQSYPSNIF